MSESLSDANFANALICFECGYDLRGLPKPVRCPECGLSYSPDKERDDAIQWFDSWRGWFGTQPPVRAVAYLSFDGCVRSAGVRRIRVALLFCLLTSVVATLAGSCNIYYRITYTQQFQSDGITYKGRVNSYARPGDGPSHATRIARIPQFSFSFPEPLGVNILVVGVPVFLWLFASLVLLMCIGAALRPSIQQPILQNDVSLPILCGMWMSWPTLLAMIAYCLVTIYMEMFVSRSRFSTDPMLTIINPAAFYSATSPLFVLWIGYILVGIVRSSNEQTKYEFHLARVLSCMISFVLLGAGFLFVMSFPMSISGGFGFCVGCRCG